MMRIAAATVLVCSVVAFNDQILAPAQPIEKSAANDLLAGHAFYYAGNPKRAILSYRSALQRDPKRISAWLNGAVLWSEMGKLDESATWYRNALALKPESSRIATALAEAEIQRGQNAAAAKAVEHALKIDEKAPYAWIAKGRVLMESGRADDAAEAFERAAALRPTLTLAHYWKGRALTRAGRAKEAGEAYSSASSRDSYFTSARFGLAESLVRQRRYREARKQISRLGNTAPSNKEIKKLSKALARKMRRSRGIQPKKKSKSKKKSRTSGRRARVALPAKAIPRLRVGIGTTGMGKPLVWKSIRFSGSGPVEIRYKKGGKRIARIKAGQSWRLGISKKGYLEIRDEKGFPTARTRRPIIIKSRSKIQQWIWVREAGGKRGLSRRLRGEVEVGLRGKGLTVINTIDLESYTHGVLTAEMPIESPIEALKAQAVLARTHALFIKDVRRRHRADGYTLCDGQHCQVYRGVQAETLRSRRVVNATRGRVVSFHGSVANVLYSSNCGGHTQSSSEIQGWGDVPYFHGTKDGDSKMSVPHSPWQLRQSLREPVRGFCAASSFVYSGHSRWSRVISARDLEARLHRHLGIGKLKAILPLKRSRSGHLNSILVKGSKRSRIVDSEIRIRGLFGIGSQRSSLFVMDMELGSNGRPKNFVFYGGGWGHGVGLCQSGAMGRAHKGHSYSKILQAYYRGIEIGNLRY
ncbi:MAG: hypothetical protein COB53_13255 [Elusimicrobia bacterium]|nr:MAG: hypothetical protein COB53_13255 [Elusimicrobiota bacterium]